MGPHEALSGIQETGRGSRFAESTPLVEVETALASAGEYLLAEQRDDGHWCAELEGDSVLESEFAMLLHFLGREDSRLARKAAEQLRRSQMPDSGWSLYPGGPVNVSSTVKAYFVLKLMGDDPEAPHMARARQAALELGGVEATNTYTKIYLAMFGQYPWDRCPAIPPEMMLLPDWFYFNVYEMSSWSRGIFVPLSIIWAHRPVRDVPPEEGIPELFAETRPEPPRPGGNGPRARRWRSFFYTADRALKVVERLGLHPFRRRALREAERWIRYRLEMSDGLGAIFPAILNTLIAFDCLGHGDDDPGIRSQWEALEGLVVEEEDIVRVQPALSPVWDTAQSVASLRAAGVEPDRPALARAAGWLLEREVRHEGDWIHSNPDGEPGGWYFEYANEFYPDCDDTAEVLIALGDLDVPDGDLALRIDAARRRGLAWLLSMQNHDGGWAAFDRECDREVLTFVPFADHNAMIDPSCEDITGRILRLLDREGLEPEHPAVREAREFLRRTQEEDGTWYGRWGCNYIYGTWLALSGLEASGEDMTRERYQRTARWLVSRQNEDGGWGESLATYDDPSLKGRGPSTAAQTAWAVLGLRATGHGDSEAARRGVEYLLKTQREDGSWVDEHWTGTGFPRVFYLRYGYYDDYFPLLALAEYRDEWSGNGLEEAELDDRDSRDDRDLRRTATG